MKEKMSLPHIHQGSREDDEKYYYENCEVIDDVKKRDREDFCALEDLYRKWIDEKNREYNKTPEEKWEQELAIRKKIEKQVRTVSVLRRFLRMYYKRDLAIERSKGGDTFEISVRDENVALLPKLPHGYLYKGGAARAILKDVLGKGFQYPRDLDIVVREGAGNEGTSEYLAQKYMEDDFANGHGVEKLEDDYFETRDFTINEVLFDGSEKKIVATKACLIDTIRNTIRLAEYEKKERKYGYGDYYVSPKLLAKALRFLAEGECRGEMLIFGNEEVFQWIGIDYFHAALHLDRAIGQGYDVATKYVHKLKKLHQLSESVEDVDGAVQFLSDKLHNFFFRFTTSEQELLDDVLDKYGITDNDYILPKREPLRKNHKSKS